MNEPLELSERHLDALREVVNIGAGHAASALSSLVREKVLLGVPRVVVAPFADAAASVAAAARPAVALKVQVLGDLAGSAVFLMREKDARELTRQLLRRPGQEDTPADERMAESALKEVGNILGAAYLNALATLIGVTLLPSIPELVTGDPAAVVGAAFGEGAPGDIAVSVETEFHVGEKAPAPIGYFLFCPQRVAVRRILDALRVD